MRSLLAANVRRDPRELLSREHDSKRRPLAESRAAATALVRRRRPRRWLVRLPAPCLGINALLAVAGAIRIPKRPPRRHNLLCHSYGANPKL